MFHTVCFSYKLRIRQWRLTFYPLANKIYQLKHLLKVLTKLTYLQRIARNSMVFCPCQQFFYYTSRSILVQRFFGLCLNELSELKKTFICIHCTAKNVIIQLPNVPKKVLLVFFFENGTICGNVK